MYPFRPYYYYHYHYFPLNSRCTVDLIHTEPAAESSSKALNSSVQWRHEAQG